MRLDLDTYKEILDTITRNKSRSLLTGFGVFWGENKYGEVAPQQDDTITRNKSRSLLTGFGVFWGVFMLIALMGGGQGLKEMLQNNFTGFATNTAIIWAQNTTKPYKGFNKGRSWQMEEKDLDRLRHQVPELDVITPLLFGGNKSVVFGDKKFSGSTQGVNPDYAQVSAPQMCDPCGKSVRVDSTYYMVIGVDYRSGNGVNFGGRADETITLPQSVLRSAYNRGKAVDIIATTGKPGVVMSSIAQRMRETVARAHSIDPTDEKGIMVFNTEVLFQMLDNLFKGVNFLIWLVGIGTLLAGAIGVSNIMMVTVKERTTEIGIRRAIGATPKMILSQIISESILLTLVAGMSGILFGVAILQMLEVGSTTDGILTAHFQVDFWTAISSAILICILGGLAGLAPAWRAMSIKPVDAMRDE